MFCSGELLNEEDCYGETPHQGCLNDPLYRSRQEYSTDQVFCTCQVKFLNLFGHWQAAKASHVNADISLAALWVPISGVKQPPLPEASGSDIFSASTPDRLGFTFRLLAKLRLPGLHRCDQGHVNEILKFPWLQSHVSAAFTSPDLAPEKRSKRRGAVPNDKGHYESVSLGN